MSVGCRRQGRAPTRTLNQACKFGNRSLLTGQFSGKNKPLIPQFSSFLLQKKKKNLSKSLLSNIKWYYCRERNPINRVRCFSAEVRGAGMLHQAAQPLPAGPCGL